MFTVFIKSKENNLFELLYLWQKFKAISSINLFTMFPIVFILRFSLSLLVSCSLFRSVWMSVYASLLPCLFFSLSLSVPVSLFLSVCLYLAPYIYLSLSVRLFIAIYLAILFCLSLSLFLSILHLFSLFLFVFLLLSPFSFLSSPPCLLPPLSLPVVGLYYIVSLWFQVAHYLYHFTKSWIDLSSLQNCNVKLLTKLQC